MLTADNFICVIAR